MSWFVTCQCCTVSVRKVKVLTFLQVHVKSLKWEMIKEVDRKEEEQKILTDMSCVFLSLILQQQQKM